MVLQYSDSADEKQYIQIIVTFTILILCSQKTMFREKGAFSRYNQDIYCSQNTSLGGGWGVVAGWGYAYRRFRNPRWRTPRPPCHILGIRPHSHPWCRVTLETLGVPGLYPAGEPCSHGHMCNNCRIHSQSASTPWTCMGHGYTWLNTCI